MQPISTYTSHLFLTVSPAVFGWLVVANGDVFADSSYLYVAESAGHTVGKYDAATGAVINASLVDVRTNPEGPTNWGLFAVGVSGNNLYVGSNNGIGVYDATTGAAINSTLLTGGEKRGPTAISGNSIYVAETHGHTVGKYDATTGAVINANLVDVRTNPEGPTNWGLFAVVVSGNNLYVGSNNGIGVYDATTGAAINSTLLTGGEKRGPTAISGNSIYVAETDGHTVGKYDATTGAVINANLVDVRTNPEGPTNWGLFAVAISGNNLYVGSNNGIGVYDATTGAAINSTLLTGGEIRGPIAIVVPEPATALLLLGSASLFGMRRRHV
jgi:outer membrane protein assembly factor BamB